MVVSTAREREFRPGSPAAEEVAASPGGAMQVETISADRQPDGSYEAETLWVLTDAEVAQLQRTGLSRPQPDRNILTQVHHVLSQPRSSTRGQRIITRADGWLLHADGMYLPPDIDPEDPQLWVYTSSGPGLSRWVRRGAGPVGAYLFPRTSDDEDEWLDPQWQRETFTRDPVAELAAIADWKGTLLDGQLTRGEPIEAEQRTTLNLQVGAAGDDSHASGDSWPTVNGWATQTSSGIRAGTTSSDIFYHSIYRFTSVSGLSGVTISTATLSLYGQNTELGTPQTNVGADDLEAPTAPTTAGEAATVCGNATTALVTWDNPDLVTDDYTASPEIKTVIQELADSYDPSAIQILVLNDLVPAGANHLTRAMDYDTDSGTTAKLDIDYTAGGGGGPDLEGIERHYPRGAGRGVLRGAA